MIVEVRNTSKKDGMGDKEAVPVNPVVFFDITLGGKEASLCTLKIILHGGP